MSDIDNFISISNKYKDREWVEKIVNSFFSHMYITPEVRWGIVHSFEILKMNDWNLTKEAYTEGIGEIIKNEKGLISKNYDKVYLDHNIKKIYKKVSKI